MKNFTEKIIRLFFILFLITGSLRAQCSDGYVPDPNFVSNSA